jgi:hypothetical protein
VRGQLLPLTVDVKDTSALQPAAPMRWQAREPSLRSLLPLCVAFLENFSAGAKNFVQ